MLENGAQEAMEPFQMKQSARNTFGPTVTLPA